MKKTWMFLPLLANLQAACTSFSVSLETRGTEAIRSPEADQPRPMYFSPTQNAENALAKSNAADSALDLERYEQLGYPALIKNQALTTLKGELNLSLMDKVDINIGAGLSAGSFSISANEITKNSTWLLLNQQFEQKRSPGFSLYAQSLFNVGQLIPWYAQDLRFGPEIRWERHKVHSSGYFMTYNETEANPNKNTINVIAPQDTSTNEFLFGFRLDAQLSKELSIAFGHLTMKPKEYTLELGPISADLATFLGTEGETTANVRGQLSTISLAQNYFSATYRF